MFLKINDEKDYHIFDGFDLMPSSSFGMLAHHAGYFAWNIRWLGTRFRFCDKICFEVLNVFGIFASIYIASTLCIQLHKRKNKDNRTSFGALISFY